MNDLFLSIKGLLSTALTKYLVGCIITVIAIVLSKSVIGRHVKVVILGWFRRVDEEEAKRYWRTAVQDLNVLEVTEASVYSLQINGMPAIRQLTGLLPSELEWMQQANVVSEWERRRPRVNKSHGFVTGDEFRKPGSFVITYVRSDYAMVQAAKAVSKLPPILSANALVFCPATRRLVLMIRAKTVRTYPNALHFLGGNYEPARGHEEYDDVDIESPLRRTAIREVEEESKIKIRKPYKGFVIVGEEHTTGFIQFTYAALYVTEWQMRKMKGSREGSVLAVSFKELVEFAKTGKLHSTEKGEEDLKITPSCTLAIMAWLRLGAPDQNGAVPVKKEALATYEELRTRIHHRLATVSH